MAEQNTTLPQKTQTKVKFCGLFREVDVQYANQTQPDYVGFVVGVPKSHRNVTPEQLVPLRQQLSPTIQTVGVFVNPPLSLLATVAPVLDVFQLHGSEEEAFLIKVRQAFPEKEIWKAFSVRTAEDVAQALAFPADKILLDYGKGEGKAFDWGILEGITKPYILAGGLTPENVAEALSRFHPTILDLSSGIETDQKKDLAKMQKLMSAGGFC